MTLAAYPGKSDPIDTVSSGLIVTDFEHHEIHDGDHFDISDLQSMSNNVDLDYLLITPDLAKWMHTIFGLDSDAKASIALYEAPTTSANGTPLTAYNNNRNSATAATLQVFRAPTVSAAGTQIDIHMVGSSGKSGGTKRDTDEWVLKVNTKYLLRIHSFSALQMVFHLDWYEH